jgi:hypothetical protein
MLPTLTTSDEGTSFLNIKLGETARGTSGTGPAIVTLIPAGSCFAAKSSPIVKPGVGVTAYGRE